MKQIDPRQAWPLFDTASTRALEQQAARHREGHGLMAAAGLAVARLALAVAPHARTIWLACGPGNNGGDGLEAAAHLAQEGKQAVVTWLGTAAHAPADSQEALRRAQAAGVTFAESPPASWDLCIDALLGIGASRPPEGRMAQWMALMQASGAPVLAVDGPSGLNTDTGCGTAVQATHTLSLLTLKPGLFTAQGRDACGNVWWDDLGCGAELSSRSPDAWLGGAPAPLRRPHASHKGSFGDVAVIGGDKGMGGAALLAASAALHAGAGRVYAALLGDGSGVLDPTQPELMLRPWDSLDLSALSVACGCGGGGAVRPVLPAVLSRAARLVLDADALNAIAADSALQALLRSRAGRAGRSTVITPHPLEAARLLSIDTAGVQGDRLAAARRLARDFGCVALLKGSGTVIATPDAAPVINPTGNGRLASAGTGDVLAGMIAARLAQGEPAADAAAHAAWQHGRAADLWPTEVPLTAGALARQG